MAEFAVDVALHEEILEPDQTRDFPFGPPTPGPARVLLSAVEVLDVPPPGPGVPDPIEPGGGGAGGGFIPLLRPAGPSSVLGATRVGGLGGLVLDPGLGGGGGGGGFPPPNDISPTAFDVEILDGGGNPVASGEGPFEFEVPPAGPPFVTASPLGGLGSPAIARVTNTSRFRAKVTLRVLFHGHRPILSKDVDLDFLNEKLDLVWNDVQPIRIGFENRKVGELTINGRTIPIVHSFIVVEGTIDPLGLFGKLAGKELDLGRRLFDEGTRTTRIEFKATIHDGALAFRMRAAFPFRRGVIDGAQAIKMFAPDLLVDVVDTFVDFDIEIIDLVVDVFLVLRANGLEIVTRPRIDLNPRSAGLVAEGAFQLAFERLIPEMLEGDLRDAADKLLTWILGDAGRELTGSEQKLALEYAGDAPSPFVVQPNDPRPRPAFEPGNLEKIDHIVVLTMENRSFDHMLGFLSLPTSGNDGRVGLGRDDVDGLRGDETNPVRAGGARVRVFSLAEPGNLIAERPTRGTVFHFDPDHSFGGTRVQRGAGGGRRSLFDLELSLSEFVAPTAVIGPNEGFIVSFAEKLSRQQGLNALQETLLRGEIMGYQPAEHVPVYRFLSEEYAVCDRWYASHPGPTWPNRFVELTGGLAVGPDRRLQLDNPDIATFDPLETPTVFDHLLNAGVEWNYFEHDFCMLRLFSRYTLDTERVLSIDDPERGFFARAARGDLAPVTFIDPDLSDAPPSASDDHPPADISAGQDLVQRIYDALADGPREQWEKTLFVIVYDEHGGFHDHVHPESKSLFDRANPVVGDFAPIGSDEDGPIDHYGMRVPALVVSPWIPERTVAHETFDHTSILKTILARFLHERPPDMGPRVDLARDLGSLLTLDTPRRSFRPPDFVIQPVAPPLLVRESPRERGDEFRELVRSVRRRARL